MRSAFKQMEETGHEGQTNYQLGDKFIYLNNFLFMYELMNMKLEFDLALMHIDAKLFFLFVGT